MYIPNSVVDFLKSALDEDVGHGDLATSLVVDPSSHSTARVMAKEATVLAGMPFLEKVFEIVDSSVRVERLAGEGGLLQRGDAIAMVYGKTASLLTAERLALNVLQRLSGVATLTRRFVEAVVGLNVKIVDTRKTTPNMRFMEKYAVRVGGGANHRFGLYDGVLIKDNHIAAAGSIIEAVRRAGRVPLLTKVEVEVKNLDELKEALLTGVDVIMLDNMGLEDMRRAVEIARAHNMNPGPAPDMNPDINPGMHPDMNPARARKQVIIEASGNVTLDTVRQIAETGVDVISSGALTHSARASDISMKLI